MKNIVFLLDAPKLPSGGAKVIYQYSNFINSLEKFTSSIIFIKKKRGIKNIFNEIKKKFFLKSKIYTGWNFKEIEIKKNFRFKWFHQKINVKNDFKFSKKNDFVILPEIFAHFAEDLLIKKKIQYAIFVQNGYALSPTNNIKKLDLAYKKAKYILSYSDDIKQCIGYVYPDVKKKIVEVRYSIDSKKFNILKKKENLITYMTRKLPNHSKLVLDFLRKSLPSNWKLKAIHNLAEVQVYKILSKSKIFLAFSELEGLPLPPVEAALSGNKVMGYTGEGGKQYWKEPIFTEIKSGEIKNFCKSIMKNLSSKNFLKKSLKQRVFLSKYFSLKAEQDKILKFLAKIK